MRYSEFEIRYLPKTMDQLSQGRLFEWSQVVYPDHCVIHFQTDTANAVGIHPTYPLINHRETPIRVFHWETFEGQAGNPRRVSLQSSGMVTLYFRSSPRHIHRARQLDRSVQIRTSLTVIDYSLLPMMVQYPASRRLVVEQHLNYLTAMRKGVETVKALDIRGEVPQVIPMPMPGNLPDLTQFRQTEWPVPQARIKHWDSFRKLNLLWVWQAIESDSHELWSFPDETLLAFALGNQGFMVSVGHLREWRGRGADAVQLALYKGWSKLMETRTDAPTEALTEATDNLTDDEIDAVPLTGDPSTVIGMDRIQANVTPLIEAGKLSRGEVKRIERLATRYKELPNPIGEGTLEDAIQIPTEKLVISDSARKLVDRDSIIDKSMLDSTVNTFHSAYIENVMESDILRTLMSTQNAGGLVKSMKVEEGQDALNDYKVYKVELVPVNGAPSTLSIKLPKVSSDGEFLANGVKYRMDVQKGD